VLANPADHYTGLTVNGPEWRDGEKLATLYPAVAFFLPEHAMDPTRVTRSTTLFVEVTIPRKGPPRPIRFARNLNGTFAPIDVQ
jgi:hypothetical protein